MTQLATVDLQTGEIVEATGRHLPSQFKPEEARAKRIAIDAGLRYAADLGDMDAIQRAAEVKVQHVADCVEWWRGNVSGQGRPKKDFRTEMFLSVDEAQEILGIRIVQISRWFKRLKDRQKFTNQIAAAAIKKAIGAVSESSQLVQQSLSNEHYTPERYIEAARSVLGAIDVDPASCLKANQVVKATRYFTAKDDGLAKEWRGRIWLNPPYGGDAGRFIAKLAEELSAGHVTAAIVLVNAHCTDTARLTLTVGEPSYAASTV